MQLWQEGQPLLPEDEAFLNNMKTTRTATMVGRDKKLQSLVKRREARAKQTAAYQQLQMEQKRSYETICLKGTYHIFVIIFFLYILKFLFIFTDSSDGSSSEKEESEPCTIKAETRSHTRSVKTGVTLTIPHDVIGHQAIVAHQVRTGATVSGTIFSYLKLSSRHLQQKEIFQMSTFHTLMITGTELNFF